VADDEKPDRATSWWQTMPGVMTGIAALITALTGLLVAAHQAGLFGSGATLSGKTTESGRAVTKPVAPAEMPTASAQHSVPAPMVEFTLPQTVTVGKGDGVKFTFTQATVEPRNAETLTLLLQARMSNPGQYPANFWDNSFRLRTHNAVVAASGGVNEVVPGGADSPMRTLRFTVNRGSIPSALLIDYGGESTELPLRFLGGQR
jgi:plastocyanin